MNLLFCLFFYVLFVQSLIKEFQAIHDFLLIEIFSDEWPDMKIEVAENQLIMGEIAQESTQYLSMYYKLKIGVQYKLDIFVLPDSNVTIQEVPQRNCPNNCSNQGICQNLQCHCQSMAAGYKMLIYKCRDRCQFEVAQLYNMTQYSANLKPHQTQIIGVFYQQSQMIDDQNQTRNFQIQSSSSINSQIFLLYPFQSAYSNMVDSKLIYEGQLKSTPQEIDYSSKFQRYHIEASYFTFLLVLKNMNSQKQDVVLKYQLLDNDQKFQDFILVAILSVISFIILLIIIYVVRRRCQFQQQSKIKENQEEDFSDNIAIQFMPIVNPVKDQVCVICLDPLDDRLCRQTPCKHIMHDNCLKQWIQKQLSCPMCRETFNDVEYIPRVFKSRNQTSNTLILSHQGQSIVQSERNSVRSMIITRTRQSRLAVFQ
ncbi:unnamed protein product (macronuclear) [Paramecium tetraurelia]|uniref:RING-type domain-containing protein n=1 Tax=Paramecium tetraurelia TaxID=5888 RepID=A0BE23_PARTE|nr:uncharacterized protein GSPATT00027822001 [Paramecium tetraurelia]CAK56790.1 unnamed protein product [Paramecium tetraurelia]|eukprot:XP_001424188.1 hypothetical protein (macronuclear) [Paramecium tetraurelia strain d4-2]